MDCVLVHQMCLTMIIIIVVVVGAGGGRGGWKRHYNTPNSNNK